MPVTNLKDSSVAWGYGSYAPGGNCAGPTSITVDVTGFTFFTGGQKAHPPRVQQALDFVRGADPDQVAWFFPFPKSDSDFGPIMLTMNRHGANIELDNETGKPLTGPYAALLAGSPYKKCAGTAAPAAKPAPAAAKPAPAPAAAASGGKRLDWAALPKLADGNGYWFGLAPGDVTAALQGLLGSKMAVLGTNLSVSSAITRAGTVYYTIGNAEHRGGLDMAYVLLDAPTRAMEVGLWEGGKLTVYRSAGKRVAMPAEVAKFRDTMPPEDAVAVPGPPWELRPIDAQRKLALGVPAASTHIDTIALMCNAGQPILSMKLYRPPAATRQTLSFVFNGQVVNIVTQPDTSERLYWTGLVAGSPLLKMLAAQRDQIYLRIDGRDEGELNPQGAAQAARQALAGCYRF